jgi:hypothetical protein
MKKYITTLCSVLLLGLLSTLNLFAQAPDAMLYQAEARGKWGHLIRNKTVEVRIAIQEGSMGGPEVWVNNYTVETDVYGLFTITIGDPTNANDDLYNIDWGINPYFLDVQIRHHGIWRSVGTTQFLSVPYALHAETATNALSANYEDIEGAPTDLSEFTNFAGYITNAMEQDPVFNAWNKSTGISITESQISDLKNYLTTESDPFFSVWDMSTGISITESQITDLDHFTNADETDPSFNAWDKSTGISITESQISDLVHFNNDDETDPLFLAAPASSISEVNIANWIAAYGWGDHSEAGYLTSELDADPTNELQDLSDLALKSNVLELDNTTEFAPNADYEPATKKYVDDLRDQIETLEARIESIESIESIEIGDFHGGGVVFYILQPGDDGFLSGETHGLICALNRHYTSAEWGCPGTPITGSDGSGIGSGAQNTIDIVTGCASAGTTAAICANLTLNGYNDWYLPSKDELNLMYQGGFFCYAVAYWSSTEEYDNGAWLQYYGNGLQEIGSKSYSASVLAIRAF